MKELRLFLAILLAPLVFQAASADDADDIARAATRRIGTTSSVQQPLRQKTSAPEKSSTTTKTGNVSRITSTETKASPTKERTPTNNTRTATTQQIQTPARAITQRVQNRPTQNIIKRNTIRTTPAAQNAPSTTNSRSATISRTGNIDTTNLRETQPTTRYITRTNNQRISRAAIMARSGTDTPTANDIISRDYKKCREVFYNCMDEFCANKDSQLRRCACSSRMNEFDGAKKQLAQVEDKLLDFSQRLLTVSMDTEDAAVLNQATEGELAFYASEDKSTSKQMLDEISKKLNTSFDNSELDQGLNAISLSLNTDAAFDSIDSMLGASTTTKSGTELYSAALPVCREMAMEVCTAEELSIAEGGYQVMIEQDCTTVAKSYETQTEQARTQLLESSALLDISRLDIHQKRNSDDILTCKKKMITMLTDTTVCGKNMEQCLDMTGRYIDPSTGEAFLTTDLANLKYLISRPENGKKWQTMSGNESFVLFLNSKKKFLEPAMEHCQDIADYVWTEFLEDALAQIKLAQESKLEEVRQSCTTLTTQCLDNAYDSISEFDARALSIFGVSADTTVNAMCTDVKTACTALLETIGGGEDWKTGVDTIVQTKTYETIIKTCREVGKNCIIQACTSITGNFGLCENIETSINRKSIINRSACWDEVYECIANAGDETIESIMKDADRNRYNSNTGYTTPYRALLGYNNLNPHDWCTIDDEKYCNNNQSIECAKCRLTEQIWGHCDKAPTATDTSSKIIENTNSNEETLLSWFARNTNTNSCKDTTCGAGLRFYEGSCVDEENLTSFGTFCASTSTMYTFDGTEQTDCCTTKKTFTYTNDGNQFCCANELKAPETTATNTYETDGALEFTNVCAPSNNNMVPVVATAEYILYCNGGVTPGDNTIKCSGDFIKVDKDGYTRNPSLQGDTTNYNIINNIQVTKADSKTTIEKDNQTIDVTSWTINYNPSSTTTQGAQSE